MKTQCFVTLRRIQCLIDKKEMLDFLLSKFNYFKDYNFTSVQEVAFLKKGQNLFVQYIIHWQLCKNMFWFLRPLHIWANPLNEDLRIRKFYQTLRIVNENIP